MTYVIINKNTGKRVRQKGSLTPFFQYPAQAVNYIERRLGGSQVFMPYKVK